MDTSSFDTLNGLLRAELSATSTYRHVLQNADEPRLHRICEDHRESASLLTAQIRELGGSPSEEASTWKAIDLLATSSHLLSDPIALKALVEGERQDVLSYETALFTGRLAGEARELVELVERMLLPRTTAHIDTLEEMLCAA